MRFGRVPKREKARILAAMQQSSSSRAHEQAAAAELDDAPRLMARVMRAHLDTCEFTRERVATMRSRARNCPTYSQPTLVSTSYQSCNTLFIFMSYQNEYLLCNTFWPN